MSVDDDDDDGVLMVYIQGGSMASDRCPSDSEHQSLQRSNSAKKDEVLSTSFSVSTPSSVYRQLRQHRNSWPTIEATARAIKRQ